MNQIMVDLLPIKLVGITVKTSNAAEMVPETAKIGKTMQHFFSEKLQDKILNRKNPGKILAIYTNYQSDEYGEYTYFLGEEVTSFENNLNENFEFFTIPAQNYMKFTSDPGQMPLVVIDMWQKIWKMNNTDLGGARAYVADFEVYDERSHDPMSASLDIYIGVKK